VRGLLAVCCAVCVRQEVQITQIEKPCQNATTRSTFIWKITWFGFGTPMLLYMRPQYIAEQFVGAVKNIYKMCNNVMCVCGAQMLCCASARRRVCLSALSGVVDRASILHCDKIIKCISKRFIMLHKAGGRLRA
jgi:hypothetical protein